MILYFKMVIFKEYSQILVILNTYSYQFTSNLKERYIKYCLIEIVKDFLENKNKQIKVIESETVFMF